MTAERLAEINAIFPELAFDLRNATRFLETLDNLLLLAWCENHLCGVLIGYRLQRLDRREAEVLLYSIDVHEPFRRSGVGRLLVEATKQWATAAGADEVWVLTERSNGPAMALYRAAGGKEDSPDTTMLVFALS